MVCGFVIWANGKTLMAGNSVILIPPSEGKASGGEGRPLDFDSLSFESLNSTRARMAKALVQLSDRPRVAQKLLGVKGTALEQAKTDNANLEHAPTLPAIDRYTGVMYDFIDYWTLDEAAREVFGRDVIIMSGLFGIVRPFDLIPSYKLKMGAKLIRSKTCAAVWKPLITKTLADDAADSVIWDLLPNEHSAAWDSARVTYESRFTVKFLERRDDGQLKTINHWSKALKGALIRHLVSNPEAAGSAETALELASIFSHPEGYEFSQELTSQNSDRTTELVYLKG